MGMENFKSFHLLIVVGYQPCVHCIARKTAATKFFANLQFDEESEALIQQLKTSQNLLERVLPVKDSASFKILQLPMNSTRLQLYLQR